MSATAVYLVRHGDAAWTLDEERPLSAEGRRQADAVADALEPLAPEAIYSSPYARARQTVEPLAARLRLPVHERWDFRERQLTDQVVTDFVGASRATWEDFSLAHPGGESNAEAQRRGEAALKALVDCHPGGRIVVGTHGTLLALMLSAFDRTIGFGFWRGISTPDIYRLDVGPARVFTIERVWKT